MLVKVIKNAFLVMCWILLGYFFLRVMSLPSPGQTSYTQDVIGLSVSALLVWFALWIRKPPRNRNSEKDWNSH